MFPKFYKIPNFFSKTLFKLKLLSKINTKWTLSAHLALLLIEVFLLKVFSFIALLVKNAYMIIQKSDSDSVFDNILHKYKIFFNNIIY